MAAVTKPFSRFHAEILKPWALINLTNEAATRFPPNRMETKMRTITLSLILAFTVVLSNISMAGSTNNGVPNAGLFAFGAPTAMAVASR